MLKSRLYWKVLANFGLLIVIITAMTLMTVYVLRNIESDFQHAGKETQFLSDLEQITYNLSDLTLYADSYARTGDMHARLQYEQHLRDATYRLNEMIVSTDDVESISLLTDAAKHLSLWADQVGSERINRGNIVPRADNQDESPGFESTSFYNDDNLYYARNVIRELHRKHITEHNSNIGTAANISQNLSTYIYIVNILILIFAIVLGLVLTRSIIKPLQKLRTSTERLTDGTFEPIRIDRRDELGDLYENFNKMSVLVYSQFKKLRVYSELVSQLNTTSNIRNIAKHSLSHLCLHTDSFAGTLYIFNKQTEAFEQVRSIGFESNGSAVHSVKHGEGIIGECAEKRERIDYNITNPEETVLPGLVFGEKGLLIAIPLEFRDRVVGVIALATYNSFDETHNEVINQSLPQIAVSISNARHYEETQNLSLEIAHKSKEVNRKNDELEKAYRIKSDFLSSISHELRTPLNSVIGYSSVLLNPDAEPLSKEQQKAIRKVLKNGKHLLQLINDILDISKIESGRMSLSIDTDIVSNVVNQSVLTVEPLMLKKKLKLKKNIQSDIPKLQTDILKVRQVLINLLSNAVKFTEQGTITVRVYYRERKVYFEVRDPGIGIPEEELETIFDDFKQVDSGNTRKYKGTGLGLPIARRLARLLGGDITVHSRPGRGSIFTFCIPPVLVPGHGKNGKNGSHTRNKSLIRDQKPATTAVNRQSGFNILCIDDDPDAIQILKNHLLPEGYSVTGAMSGEEGLQNARLLKPSLITLDILLPDKDGWQVLRELKNDPATRSIPVIIHSIIENQPLALQLGAIDVMPKPVDANRLLSLVQLSCATKDQYVLLVDDNREFSMVMRELIEHDGFRVQTADNGKEALDMVKQNKPAIIFLDLVMPEMDGFAFIKELKSNESLNDIPVIILSGKPLTRKEKEYLDSNIQHYMNKEDFSHEAIVKSIKRILAPNQV